MAKTKQLSEEQLAEAMAAPADDEPEGTLDSDTPTLQEEAEILAGSPHTQVEQSSDTIPLTRQEFTELKEQQDQLLRALAESETQKRQMAEALEVAQRYSATVQLQTAGEKLLDGAEFGPYADYTFVPTPFGEYACPLTKVLFFVGVQRLNRETLEMELVPIPQYRKATQEELEAAKSPSMLPLKKSALKPKRSWEEAMTAFIDAQTTNVQGLAPLPVPTDGE